MLGNFSSYRRVTQYLQIKSFYQEILLQLSSDTQTEETQEDAGVVWKCCTCLTMLQHRFGIANYHSSSMQAAHHHVLETSPSSTLNTPRLLDL